MLHLRNQQLYARENRISRPSPRSRRTVAQSPTERFAFSIFTPRSSFSLSPNPFSLCDFPRSSVHLRSQELVRPQRNGRSVAFWTRACSQEDTKEKFTSRLSVRSLFISFCSSFFFRLVQIFGLHSVSLSMQSPLAVLRSNVSLRCFKDLSYLFDPAN